MFITENSLSLQIIYCKNIFGQHFVAKNVKLTSTTATFCSLAYFWHHVIVDLFCNNGIYH